jgi:ERCC4-type nuclease
MEVWIDSREQKIINTIDLDDKKYIWKVKTLNAGDFAIVYRDYILCIIERKTWIDLAATFLSPQRKFNYEKMIEQRANNGCRLYYFIEGPPPKSKAGRVTMQSLEAHLDHLAYDHYINVIYTHSLNHTVERIEILCKNVASSHTNPLKMIDEWYTSNGYVVNTITNNTQTSEINIADVWTKIRGVTINNYEIIKERCKLWDLVLGKVEIEAFNNCKYNSGVAMSNKQITNIMENAKHHDAHIRIIAAVPRCSEKIAKLILDSYPIEKIPTLTKDEISNLKQSNGRRIGDVMATKIMELFSL